MASILWRIGNAGDVYGRACDPDGTLCEWPRIDLSTNGIAPRRDTRPARHQAK